MIAIQSAWRAGLFRRACWLPNIIAGMVVGVIALPLAMAFAVASGVEPSRGIYTAIAAGVLVSIFGGSRVQIAGPTGAFVALLGAIVAKHGWPGLQIATMMAGALLVAMGLTRMGSLIKYIPAPVITGFTSGIAVVIAVGQLKDFLGLSPRHAEHFHEKLVALVAELPHTHLPTLALGAGSLAVLLITPRIPGLRRLPAPLVAMCAATAWVMAVPDSGVATLGSAFGGIPRGLPPLDWPEFSIGKMLTLLGPALAIAMLGGIESLLSAVVADGMIGARHDSNQELIGQGIANLAAPFFGGFAATGALARTAANVRHGGASPLAGLIHAATLALILVLLAPLASHVPLCALSAILFVVAWNMAEARHFSEIVRFAPRSDVAILFITFILAIFADLVVAVNTGVLLASLHFMRRMAKSVRVGPVSSTGLAQELIAAGRSPLPPEVLVYEIEGPFFFGVTETMERAMQFTHTDPRWLILRFRRVPFVDMTGLKSLETAIHQLRKRKVSVILCEANARVARQLRKSEIMSLVCGGYARSLDGALEMVPASSIRPKA